MYSVVLMMALTSGGDVPALGHGCNGCFGCYGSCYGGCYGSCFGSCHGGKHHGSCFGGCFGGKHHRAHGCCGGCFGCYGSCYGCTGYSCCGGGHSFLGGHKHHRGHSCHGGCYGCYGSCYGGCYGSGFGCVGGVGVLDGSVVPGTVVPSHVAPKTDTPANPKKSSLDNAAPATLIVTVPADARLSIDGEATTLTSTERVFVSPALNFGREYHYTLQAEFQKDGKTVKVTKDVAITAGNATRVNLAQQTTEVASR